MNNTGNPLRADPSLRAFAAVVALLASFGDTSAAGAQGNELATRIQAHLDSLHANGRFAGAQVGVVLPDGRSFAVAVGFADTTRHEVMTTSHKLLSGSVGKTYVSAVAMQLVHEGTLRLEAPISTYLGDRPWFSRLPNAKDITFRQLMNHTSGLVRYEFKDQFAKDLTANPDKVWKPEELVAYILDTPAPFAAGQGWDYSDTNYIVLGMIMEQVTGRRYYDLVSARLLKPLKLANTVPSDRRTIPGLAQGYAGANNPFGGADAMLVNGAMVINPQFEWTGGGIASTAEDLARWGKALYEGRAFDPSMLPILLDGVPARLGQNTGYGLGVILRESPQGTLYGHSGFFPGYQAEMLYVPSAKVAIAFQVNSSVPGALGRGRSPVREVLELAQMVVASLPPARP